MTRNNFPAVPNLASLPETMVSGLPSASGSFLSYGIVTAESPCPPPGARKDEVLVYRLVSNDPPTKNDFLPTCVEYPHRSFRPEDHCVSQSVSVFTNVEALENKKTRYKNLKEKFIAIGHILREDGQVLETCSEHHLSWWLETDMPHRNFKLVTQS